MCTFLEIMGPIIVHRLQRVEASKSIHQIIPIYIQEMFNIKVTPYDLRDHCITVMLKAKTTIHDLYMKGITSGTLCRCILKGAGSLVSLKT